MQKTDKQLKEQTFFNGLFNSVDFFVADSSPPSLPPNVSPG